MSGKRNGIGGTQGKGQAPRHLHRIQMQQSAMLPAQRRDGFNGMQHASFIIGRHDRNQRGASRLQRRLQPCQVQGAVGQHREHLGRRPRRGQNGGVLGRPHQHAPPRSKAPYGQSVRLRPARGEHKIPPTRPEARRNRLPRFFQNPPRCTPLGMDRGWVAQQSHRLSHGGDGFWAHRLGRIRVQVQALHGASTGGQGGVGAAQHVPGQHISERHTVQEKPNLPPQFRPKIMGFAALPRETPRVALIAPGGRNRFFYRIYDGRDGDARRRRQQPIAAPWPAGALHQARTAEPAKKLLQIGCR